MRTSEFDYYLPSHRIAQRPAEPRDSARLMLVRRASGQISHHRFRDLPHLLRGNELLVANDTRVIPARLRGKKQDTGGAIEALLLRPIDERRWEALVRGSVRHGTRLVFEGDAGTLARATVLELLESGRRVLEFAAPLPGDLSLLGEVPLPPYIHEELHDSERYQTVYSRVAGSAAAPTAGLHFTPQLIEALGRIGVEFAFATLHVGVDTFRPVASEFIEDHTMHSEWCRLPAESAAAVNDGRAHGRPVVAVGTTAVRVLESAANAEGKLAPFEGWTDLYITPGHRFRAIDAMVTNFHFPRSTLLALVSAFAGPDVIKQAYQAAIDSDYRFYSFGDAMLIL
jgi:S-adenosylmethionine:tRNA ribosyltransferase-isomerase